MEKWTGYAWDEQAGCIWIFTSGYSDRRGVEKNMRRCIEEQAGRGVLALGHSPIWRVGSPEGDAVGELAEGFARDCGFVPEGYMPEGPIRVDPAPTGSEREAAQIEAALDEADALDEVPRWHMMKSVIAAVAGGGCRVEGKRPGCCIWASGRTRPRREALKALGMRWSPKRQAWYWDPDRKFGKQLYDMPF